MIEAKVICDSIANGIRLTTLELNYHRYIHSEVMTHRMFSRNASSSRAIPVKRMLEQVKNNPAMPIHWGKNQPGMQAKEEITSKGDAIRAWECASDITAYWAECLNKLEVHKQISNRILEPFQWIKVIVTATEWDNFFKLRLHPDAQPEIQELARCMKVAMDNSVPQVINHGGWHLPYITARDTKETSIENYIKMSVARCARVSYMNHDNTTPDIEKDLELADRLLEAGHMSPFEHQATPVQLVKGNDKPWIKGVTHLDRDGNLWSGNFRGWIQNRNLL